MISKSPSGPAVLQVSSRRGGGWYLQSGWPPSAGSKEPSLNPWPGQVRPSLPSPRSRWDLGPRPHGILGHEAAALWREIKRLKWPEFGNCQWQSLAAGDPGHAIMGLSLQDQLSKKRKVIKNQVLRFQACNSPSAWPWADHRTSLGRNYKRIGPYLSFLTRGALQII